MYELIVLMQENILLTLLTELEGRVCGGSQYQVFSLHEVGYNTFLCLLEHPVMTYIHRCEESLVFRAQTRRKNKTVFSLQSSNAGKMKA